MKLRFDPRINIGHLLTVLAALLAVGGLYYQARSVGITEKNISLKVTEVAEIAKSLEKERVERLTDTAQQIEYSNKVLGLQASTDRDLDLRYNELISSVSLSVLALSTIASTKVPDTEKTKIIRDVGVLQVTLQEILSLSTIHHERLRRLGASDLAKRPEALGQAMEEANNQFIQELEQPAKKYRSARDHLKSIVATLAATRK